MFCSSCCAWMFFFFFQAEDGIRDHCVTGVQTCALPIFGGDLALTLGPVRVLRTDDQVAALADLGADQALVPAGDDVALAEHDRPDGLAALPRLVEHGAVGQFADVMGGDRVAGSDPLT